MSNHDMQWIHEWCRWLTEEGQSGLDKSFIPFGGGARKCMGYNFAFMEIKVIATQSYWEALSMS